MIRNSEGREVGRQCFCEVGEIRRKQRVAREKRVRRERVGWLGRGHKKYSINDVKQFFS